MISAESVLKWCEELLFAGANFPPLAQCLQSIPTLESLSHLPAGTRVLLRGDLDVVVDEAGTVEDDTRLRSLLETVRYGQHRGWVQILCGHRGRKEGVSLAPVVPHLQQLIQNAGASETKILFVENWFNNETGEILDDAGQQIAAMPDGAIAVLENTRWRKSADEKPLERILAKAKRSDLPAFAERLTNYANGVREKLATVFVNDAIAASNVDLSSTLIPLAMEHAVLGIYNGRELEKSVTQTVAAELAVLSGMKLDKLDALQEMTERGVVKMVVVAGLLAIALKKATDPTFAMGNHANPEFKKIFVPQDRIDQAAGILQSGREKGMRFILPIDFILDNGKPRDSIPDGHSQLDIGPKTECLHAGKIAEFIEQNRRRIAAGETVVAFHNGVFGKFEDPAYQHGTLAFVVQLKELHDAGIAVYVGGGEGSVALKRFGEEDWVTHLFTAGGTILKSLGIKPIPYVKALFMKAIATSCET